MKKLLIALLFIPCAAWSAFQPITGSTVTVVPPAGTSLPVFLSSAVDVSPATQSITAQDTASTTTLVANNQAFVTGNVTVGSTATFATYGMESVQIQVTGTWTGTLQVESSLDGGVTWTKNGGHQKGVTFNSSSFTSNFQVATNISGTTNLRVRSLAAWTGTATVRIVTTINSDSTYVLNALQVLDGSGTSAKATVSAANALKVDGSAVTQPVSGTFFQASQPVTVTQPTVLGATVTYNGTQIVGIVQSSVLGATITYNGTQTVVSNQGTPGTGRWGVDLSSTQAKESVLVSSNTALPTSAGDAAEVRPMADNKGRLVSMPIVPWQMIQYATATLTATTSETQLIAAPAATAVNNLLWCIAGNTSVTATEITFRSAGVGVNTNSIPIEVPPNTVNVPVGLAPNVGIPQKTFGQPWTIQSSVSVTSLKVTCAYYTYTP